MAQGIEERFQENYADILKLARARLSRERPAQAFTLQATVRQVFYLGATREVRLDLPGGERGVVETPNDGTALNYSAGDVVWLAASIDDCRVLAAR